LGVLAISGVPPFSGFWSKDEILAHDWAWNDWHRIVWLLGVATAGLTVFYMFRLWYLAFHGKSRVEKSIAGHVHEAPATMLVPMYILAALALLGGFIQIPTSPQLDDWLEPVFGKFVGPYFIPAFRDLDVPFQWGEFAILLVLIAVGFSAARALYKEGPRTQPLGKLAPVYTFLSEKWYFDRLYNVVFERPTYWLSTLSWEWIDRRLIDRLVIGVARGIGDASEDIRPIESGYVRTYALSIVVGVVLVLVLAIGQR
jgi:NADH-quinone oxidoreductase subunit L